MFTCNACVAVQCRATCVSPVVALELTAVGAQAGQVRAEEEEAVEGGGAQALLRLGESVGIHCTETLDEMRPRCRRCGPRVWRTSGKPPSCQLTPWS